MKKRVPEKQKIWREIVEKEPRMDSLLSKAKAVRDEGGNSFCANTVWYRDFKPMLVKLIGFDSKQESLRTMHHYDIGYEIIYDALPNCRNCNCI